jgi:phospholipase C
MKNLKHPLHLRALAAMASLSIVMASPAGLQAQSAPTDTPIKHVVVIFDENISFDHYFATYPVAANVKGEPKFQAKAHTPSVNNLAAAGLLTQNPNSVNPFLLSPADAVTCDQDHGYADEQKAFDAGLMDKFPEAVGSGGPGCNDVGMGTGIVMGYFDGNTVTGLWNYAQYFAMSDNSFGTDFGPSTVGALNLISGNTNGATLVPLTASGKTASAVGAIGGGGTTGADIGDPRPGFDDCSSTTPGLANSTQITMTGKNIGDLLNARGITWGWFQGGFAPTGVDAKGRAICGAHHAGLAGDDALTQSSDGDYIPHHSPFQYYSQTSNPHHLPPSSVAAIGTTDQANHNYDLTSFWASVKNGTMPAVSFLKAPAWADGHPGYSDPIDEQNFVVNTINQLQNATDIWKETAVIILYDDSDGWYDHQMSPIVGQSDVSDDNLKGVGNCGTPTAAQGGGTIENGRCGYGPRQPLLVISPYSKRNFVDHSITDQASVIRFIEDNWGLGRIGGGSRDAIAGTLLNLFDFTQDPKYKLFLSPNTGELVKLVD